MCAMTYAERLVARPAWALGKDHDDVIPRSQDHGSLLAQLAAPGELIVDHPDSALPHIRQAGTLGEPGYAIQLVKEQAERSLYYFNLVFMGGHTIMQPQPHQWFCDFLQATPPFHKLLLAPRGTLKTTITEGLLLHFFIQPLGANCYFPHGKIGYLNHDEGRSTRILFGSKGSNLSEDKLVYVRTLVETNTMLRAFWPQCFWHDPKRQAIAWNNQRLFLPRNEPFVEGSIETTGVGGTITGSHFNVGLYDDLVDEKDRFSPGNMDRAYSWVHAAHFLLDDAERAHKIFTGTHWTNNDIYVRMKREDLNLSHRTYSAIQNDGTALWPEAYSLEELSLRQARLITSNKGDLYALNYLNDPRHQSIVAFNAGQLRYFRIENNIALIDDDPRDLILTQDFVPGHARTPTYPSGTQLTPAFYRAHRGELRDSLRAMHMRKDLHDA